MQKYLFGPCKKPNNNSAFSLNKSTHMHTHCMHTSESPLCVVYEPAGMGKCQFTENPVIICPFLSSTDSGACLFFFFSSLSECTKVVTVFWQSLWRVIQHGCVSRCMNGPAKNSTRTKGLGEEYFFHYRFPLETLLETLESTCRLQKLCSTLSLFRLRLKYDDSVSYPTSGK